MYRLIIFLPCKAAPLDIEPPPPCNRFLKQKMFDAPIEMESCLGMKRKANECLREKTQKYKN